jgi:hypothetical protein
VAIRAGPEWRARSAVAVTPCPPTSPALDPPADSSNSASTLTDLWRGGGTQLRSIELEPLTSVNSTPAKALGTKMTCPFVTHVSNE